LDVLDGPAVVISGAEVEVIGRQLKEALRRGWGERRAAPPLALLELAIALERLARGIGGTSCHGSGAGQGTAAEPRNSRRPMSARASGQPATLSVKEAARATEVSESYLRRLVRDEILEVRDGQGPGYAIYADSLAAWQERRRRKETDPKAA
jgi:hypothetical protein